MLGALLRTKPEPIRVAVFTDNASAETSSLLLQHSVSVWLMEPTARTAVVNSPYYVRPVADLSQAPWWASVPYLGRDRYDVVLSLGNTMRLSLLVNYKGERDLQVRRLRLQRAQFADD